MGIKIEKLHPGTYYIYAMYDADGNNNFSSSDWVSTTNTTFTLTSQSTISSATQINFTILNGNKQERVEKESQ